MWDLRRIIILVVIPFLIAFLVTFAILTINLGIINAFCTELELIPLIIVLIIACIPIYITLYIYMRSFSGDMKSVILSFIIILGGSLALTFLLHFFGKNYRELIICGAVNSLFWYSILIWCISSITGFGIIGGWKIIRSLKIEGIRIIEKKNIVIIIFIILIIGFLIVINVNIELILLLLIFAGVMIFLGLLLVIWGIKPEFEKK